MYRYIYIYYILYIYIYIAISIIQNHAKSRYLESSCIHNIHRYNPIYPRCISAIVYSLTEPTICWFPEIAVPLFINVHHPFLDGVVHEINQAFWIPPLTIWVNYNISLIWIKAILGWLLLWQPWFRRREVIINLPRYNGMNHGDTMEYHGFLSHRATPPVIIHF